MDTVYDEDQMPHSEFTRFSSSAIVAYPVELIIVLVRESILGDGFFLTGEDFEGLFSSSSSLERRAAAFLRFNVPLFVFFILVSSAPFFLAGELEVDDDETAAEDGALCRERMNNR